MQSRKAVNGLVGLLFWGLLGLLTACGAADPANVAEVDGQLISNAQWQAVLRANALLTGKLPNFSPQWKTYQVKTYADQVAVAHYSQKKHWLSPTMAASEAQAKIQQVLRREHLGLPQALNRYHLTSSALKNYVTQQVWLLAAFNHVTSHVPAPSLTEISQYYHTHQDQFVTPKEVLAREIVVKNASLAQSVSQQYKHGAHFQALAQKFSIDHQNALSGGEMGWVSIPAHSPSPTIQFLRAHSPGQEGIVHMHLGYAIIEVQAKQGGKPLPLNHTVEAGIRSELWNQSKTQVFDHWSQPIIRQAHVRIF
ncbi:peptidylprolyl isomerase [Sulfobacillus thermosulfidooxidans]|uniref:peptidylprolyl isomerase n=1 Tax=Sulfobacillus thermosulfidooxidans TaxID=28034 RepID=UPI0006B6260F|nr:peptidyl-prolyl cis-trans isomerase [Sulfobacillus thermosulfidooxidans]